MNKEKIIIEILTERKLDQQELGLFMLSFKARLEGLHVEPKNIPSLAVINLKYVRKHILEGDKVCIEFTDGSNTLKGSDHVVGIVTRVFGEEPFIEIDGTQYDLCGEGHSSIIHILDKEEK